MKKPVVPRTTLAQLNAGASQQASDKARNGLDLGPLPSLLGYALRRTQVAVFSDFLTTFSELDLRPAQFSVLLLIRHNPGCKQSDIAEALGILRPNFVAMMDELDHRGLTQRTTAKADRRSYALFLTQEGERLLDAAMLVVAEHERRLVAPLHSAEPALLLDILTRIEGGLLRR